MRTGQVSGGYQEFIYDLPDGKHKCLFSRLERNTSKKDIVLSTEMSLQGVI